MLRCEDQVEDILGTQWTMRQVLVWLGLMTMDGHMTAYAIQQRRSGERCLDIYVYVYIYLCLYLIKPGKELWLKLHNIGCR